MAVLAVVEGNHWLKRVVAVVGKHHWLEVLLPAVEHVLDC